MIRQAHLCAALSLLLAAVATMLLYQPEGVAPPEGSGATEVSRPEAAQNVPELTPTSPWVEPASVLDSRGEKFAGQLSPASAARPNPIQPRKTFTAVATGERLEDVARRVYGSEEAAERLWQANRDTLSNRDSPLEPGTLLRTP